MTMPGDFAGFFYIDNTVHVYVVMDKPHDEAAMELIQGVGLFKECLPGVPFAWHTYSTAVALATHRKWGFAETDTTSALLEFVMGIAAGHLNQKNVNYSGNTLRLDDGRSVSVRGFLAKQADGSQGLVATLERIPQPEAPWPAVPPKNRNPRFFSVHGKSFIWAVKAKTPPAQEEYSALLNATLDADAKQHLARDFTSGFTRLLALGEVLSICEKLREPPPPGIEMIQCAMAMDLARELGEKALHLRKSVLSFESGKRVALLPLWADTAPDGLPIWVVAATIP